MRSKRASVVELELHVHQSAGYKERKKNKRLSTPENLVRTPFIIVRPATRRLKRLVTRRGLHFNTVIITTCGEESTTHTKKKTMMGYGDTQKRPEIKAQSLVNMDRSFQERNLLAHRCAVGPLAPLFLRSLVGM